MEADDAPIFIGGLYRSGTSLLRAMLGQHSNIASGLETFWFDLQLNDSVCQDENFAEEGLVRRGVRRWDGTRHEPLTQHLKRLASFFGMDERKVLNMAIASRDAGDFLEKFMSSFACKEGKTRWVEKTPPNVLYMAEIFSYWPQAKFIYLIRDPRDVYSSLKRAGKYCKPHEFIQLWLHFTNAYHSAIQDGTVPRRHVLEVRYEDLALEPEKTMKCVLDFCSERWEDAAGNFNGKGDDLEKVVTQTGKGSTTLERLSRPLERGRVGAWKEEISDARSMGEIDIIVASLGLHDRWNWYCHPVASE